MTNENSTPSKSLITGLAMLGGLGMTIMVVVAAIGVFSGPDTDTNSLGLFFVIGAILLIVAIGAWAGAVRPFENFDDINVPQYHGHEHHDDEHEDEESSH